MRWSISIGNVKGTIVRIHFTFVLFLAWILLSAYAAKGVQAALSAGLFFLLLFASVLLHEFGHILTARRFGVSTPDVTLLPIGGVARLERIPEVPRQELLIALAGPAVNFVIGGALILALGGLPAHPEMDLTNLGKAIWTHLAFANLALALFNLVPAFPMDGGRALRAILASKLGYPRATRAAAATGQVIAVLFGIVGVTSGNFILVLIALFVYLAAGAEAGAAQLRNASMGALARDVMITRFETLSTDEPVESAADALIRSHQKEFLVTDASGRLAGVVTRDLIADALKKGRSDTPIGQVMSRDVTVVSPHHLADHVLDLLQGGTAAIAVVDDGRLLGMVTQENVLEYVLLSNRGGASRVARQTVSVPHVAADPHQGPAAA